MRTVLPPTGSLRNWTKPIQAARLSSAEGKVLAGCLCLVLFFLGNPIAYGEPPIFWQHWAALTSVVAFALTIRTLRPPTIPWSALAFVGFGALTAFWSPEPHVTLVFAARLIALTLLAAYVAAALEFRAQLTAVAGAGVLVVLTSAIEFARGNPLVANALASESSMLHGIQGNRNILSFTLVLALWALVARLPERGLARACWCGALAAIIGGICASVSLTGLAAVVAVIGLTFGLRLSRRDAAGRRRVLFLASSTAGALAAVGAAVYLSTGRSVSRDLVLSGRLQLWRQILDAMHGRELWIGHGWGTVWPHYWLRPPSRSETYDRIVKPLGLDYVHGHNSLMDLLPEIGVVGVALFLIGFSRVLVKAIRLHQCTTSPEHLLVARASLLGLTALALTGVTEPMSVNPVGAVLFALIAANVAGLKPHMEAQAPTETASDASGASRNR